MGVIPISFCSYVYRLYIADIRFVVTLSYIVVYVLVIGSVSVIITKFIVKDFILDITVNFVVSGFHISEYEHRQLIIGLYNYL